MPRRKAASGAKTVEVLPPENNQSQIREVKHKTEWVELRSIEEASGDIEAEELEEIEDDRPRRKTPKSERDELRKKLAQNNVTPASNLKLTIEKYSHSEVMDGAGGMSGDTEHCTKYPCVESHITNEDYLDVARGKWGPGMYRFTLRMQNKIVTAWDKRISAGASGPVIQHVNPNDPNSPQVIVQSTNGDGQQTPYQPPSMRDIMKAQKEAFKEQLEMAKLMREAYGFTPEQPQQSQTTNPEIAALELIAKNPDVMEKIAGGLAKTIFGGKGTSDDTPWWADILKDSITSGQLAPTVQGVVKALFPNGLFGGLFPGGQNNGQAQMATATVQNQTPQGADQQQRSDFVSGSQESLQQGIGQVGSSQALAGGTSGDVESAVLGGNEPQMAATPEETALRTLIDNCMRKVPPRIAFDRLMAYAEAVNDQYPQGSIDGYIDMLGSAPTDAVIEYVRSLPGGEQITALPHAKEWTAELQKLIQESQEGEG